MDIRASTVKNWNLWPLHFKRGVCVVVVGGPKLNFKTSSIEFGRMPHWVQKRHYSNYLKPALVVWQKLLLASYVKLWSSLDSLHVSLARLETIQIIFNRLIFNKCKCSSFWSIIKVEPTMCFQLLMTQKKQMPRKDWRVSWRAALIQNKCHQFMVGIPVGSLVSFPGYELLYKLRVFPIPKNGFWDWLMFWGLLLLSVTHPRRNIHLSLVTTLSCSKFSWIQSICWKKMGIKQL